MVKVFVWSALLYASETWCLTPEDTKNRSYGNVDMKEN